MFLGHDIRWIAIWCARGIPVILPCDNKTSPAVQGKQNNVARTHQQHAQAPARGAHATHASNGTCTAPRDDGAAIHGHKSPLHVGVPRCSQMARHHKLNPNGNTETTSAIRHVGQHTRLRWRDARAAAEARHFSSTLYLWSPATSGQQAAVDRDKLGHCHCTCSGKHKRAARRAAVREGACARPVGLQVALESLAVGFVALHVCSARFVEREVLIFSSRVNRVHGRKCACTRAKNEAQAQRLHWPHATQRAGHAHDPAPRTACALLLLQTAQSQTCFLGNFFF